MAEKSVKKTVAKKAPATKTVSKPATAKKPVAKKAAAKKASAAKKVADVKKITVETPVMEKYPCGCEKNCACGGKCGEHKCCKSRCGGFFKKLILFLIIFALGFVAAKMCCCNRGKIGPRPEFDNGCLVIKCPKMAEKAPMMDADHDGCITPAEFDIARKHMKRGPRPEMPSEPEMVAPAPQIAE